MRRLSLASLLGLLLLFSHNVKAAPRIRNTKPPKEEDEQEQEPPPVSSFWNATAAIHSHLVYHSTQFHQDALSLQDVIAHELETQAQQLQNAFQYELRRSQKMFRQRFLQTVFSQRVGWDRFRHSLRNHFLAGVGLWVTFRGQVHPWLKDNQGRGSLALQLGQIVWHLLDMHADLPYFPWLQDLAAMTTAAMAWIRLLPRSNHTNIQEWLPYVTFPLVLLPLWCLILEEATTSEESPILLVLTGMTSTLGILRTFQNPIPLVASSLSGAILVHESAWAEIRGNWIYMLETVLRPLLLLLHRLVWVLWRPALRWGKEWWKKRILRFLGGPTRVEKLRQTLRSFGSFLTAPLHQLTTAVAGLAWIQRIHELVLALRRAIRPVWTPLGMAIWGIAVQMDSISGIGGVWKVWRFRMDPIRFVRAQVQSYLSPESRARKALLQIIRSLPRRLRNGVVISRSDPAEVERRKRQRLSNPFAGSKTM
jgi:hypothetical protein